jgi:signal peptidase II
VAELKKEERSARPIVGRAFLSRRCGVVLPDLGAQVTFWFLLTAGLALDLWSKIAVFDWLEQWGNSISIIDGFLQLVRAENTGAAFGIATGQRYLLITISVIALIVIFAVFLFSRAEQRAVHAALGLLAAGVCGNLYDRIFNDGRVRDFIDVVYWQGRHWPAFNTADSMLCVGVGLLIISTFWTSKHSLHRFTGRFSQTRAQRHK